MISESFKHNQRDDYPTESRGKMEEIFQHQKPDAIAVFSMDIVAARGREDFKSASYADLDVRGLVSGGKADVVAAAEVAKCFPEAMIVTDTRDRDASHNRPTHASVYASEIQRLGVPREHILMEENSVNTIEELAAIIKMAVNHNWHSVAIILNDFHVERTREMLAQLPSLAKPDDYEFAEAFRKFNDGGGKIVFIKAEDILLVRNPRYARLLEKVRETPAYKKRVEAETQGLRDLREGKYKMG